MKKLSLTILILAIFGTSIAQKAWILPEEINPDDSITIYIDITKCDDQALLNSTEPLYIWTWLPKDRLATDITTNGTWDASNELLKMKSEGNNIYSYRLVPTKFYNTTPSVVYDKDFHFLAKQKNGKVGTIEYKTEDLKVEVSPPASGPIKVSSFPIRKIKDTMSTSHKDIFTLIYNNNIEEKTTLQGQKDFYVYIQATTNMGTPITYATITKVGNQPELAMTEKKSGIFTFGLIPELFFASKLGPGEFIKELRFQIIRQKISSSDDGVDGTFIFVFNNICD